MIYGNLVQMGGGGSLAARMWSQAAQRPAPQQQPEVQLASLQQPQAPVDFGPVRLPGPALPGDGVSVIL